MIFESLTIFCKLFSPYFTEKWEHYEVEKNSNSFYGNNIVIINRWRWLQWVSTTVKVSHCNNYLSLVLDSGHQTDYNTRRWWYHCSHDILCYLFHDHHYPFYHHMYWSLWWHNMTRNQHFLNGYDDTWSSLWYPRVIIATFWIIRIVKGR